MARNPSAPQSAKKLLSRRVLVTIKRDQTTSTPRVVWEHEIPVLQALHGEDNVRPEDVSKLNEGYSAKVSPEMLVHNKVQDAIKPPSETQGIGFVFTGDPRVEYDRLIEAYGKHPEQDTTLAQFVYGRFQEGRFADTVGQADLTDLPEPQLRLLIRGTGYLPQLSMTPSDEERRIVAEAHKAFAAMDRDALLALADELGVMDFA